LLADPSEAAAVEAEPRNQDLAKGDTRGRKGTVVGLKRKTEDGPTPPQSKKKTKKKRQAPQLVKLLAKLRGTTSVGWCLLKATNILCLRKCS